MTRRDIRWFVLIVASLIAGCGGGNIAPGLPPNPAAPTNPTPDMDPDPKGQPVQKTP